MNSPAPKIPFNLTNNPFLDLLDLKFIGFEEKSAHFKLKVDHKHLRSLGIMHGGVTCTLLDTAMGTATYPTIPEGYFGVTAQININFIRPAWPEEELTITGTLIHAGKSTNVCRGEIYIGGEDTGNKELVASGSGTFLLVPMPTGSEMEKS